MSDETLEPERLSDPRPGLRNAVCCHTCAHFIDNDSYALGGVCGRGVDTSQCEDEADREDHIVSQGHPLYRWQTCDAHEHEPQEKSDE